MGANAQTSVPAFTAGQVLTAQQQTEINTGIPVFATTTTRDAAFGGTGEKTLAEGQMAYIENIAGSSAVQYYDGSAWQTLVTGGLTLVKTQTIGSSVSSVTVTNAFSSTYDNYKIIIQGGGGSTDLLLNMTLGASTSQYYFGATYVAWNTNAVSSASADNGTSWRAGFARTGSIIMNMDIFGPNLATNTWAFSGPIFATSANLGQIAMLHNVATAYTDFTLTTSTGTLTGGTIYVYGYQKS